MEEEKRRVEGKAGGRGGPLPLHFSHATANLCSTCFLLFDRLPTEMRQEMRDILKEYMPVGDDEEDTRSSSLLPQTNGSTMAQFEVETAI
jgi:hypothetical protein